jgi:predicted Fe-Mo cluster-binding NifX family protein
MKIALPTNDGVSMSEHFGRSAAFLVFDIENGQIKSRETRANAGCHSHAEGACNHGGTDQPDSHAGIVAVLADCSVVLSGGMGGRAAEALKVAGISATVVAASGPAESVISAYLAGKLSSGPGCACSCGH